MRPPFSWLCHQEPLPWFGDQIDGSVIPLDAHGPNRLARDETPYPLTRSCFIIFTGPSCFLLRSILLLSRESLGEASQGFILKLLSFASLLLPSRPLAPSSH